MAFVSDLLFIKKAATDTVSGELFLSEQQLKSLRIFPKYPKET